MKLNLNLTVKLDSEQAETIRSMIDTTGLEAAPITFTLTNGHSGLGLYVHQTEYPEDGAELVFGIPATHQNIARRSLYHEVARGTLQTEQPLTDMTTLVAYVGLEDGLLWLRPPSEFDDDDRFAVLDPDTGRRMQEDHVTSLEGQLADMTNERNQLKAQLEELQALINSPLTDQFLRATKNELVHQVQRWGTVHDRAKRPQDWFFLVGYLGGKALHHHMELMRLLSGESAVFHETDYRLVEYHREKAKHHTISTAAALGNWFAHIALGETAMAPGASDLVQSLEAVFGDLDEAATAGQKGGE
jgi:hypothetical protein